MVGTLGKAGATQYNLGQAQNQALYDQQMHSIPFTTRNVTITIKVL